MRDAIMPTFVMVVKGELRESLSYFAVDGELLLEFCVAMVLAK